MNRRGSASELAAHEPSESAQFVGPTRVAKQVEQVAHLPGFFLGRGIPREFLFETETVDDDGFLLAILANAFGAVTVAKAAVFAPAHGRLGNDEIDQAVVDADRAAVEFFGKTCRRDFIARKDAGA